MFAESTFTPFCSDSRASHAINMSNGAFSKRTRSPPVPLGSLPAIDEPRLPSRAERSTITSKDSPLG